jgi:hypothetical protein
MFPKTYFSVHLVDRIEAAPGISLGEPIELTIVAGDSAAQVSLYFRAGDADYTRRLIDAINSVKRTPPVVDAAHAAAHAAASDYWDNLKRDLDRDWKGADRV